MNSSLSMAVGADDGASEGTRLSGIVGACVGVDVGVDVGVGESSSVSLKALLSPLQLTYAGGSDECSQVLSTIQL